MTGPRHWAPARFFRPGEGGLLCTLCPHACVLDDGEVGVCGVRRRRGERYETATFATSVRHLDPVERKPLYHYRPGTRALTLAAPGCSFSCSYCVNYRLSQYGRIEAAAWNAESVDPEEVVAAAAASHAAVALSYSEPSLAAELTLALAEAGHRRGVEVVWKSNGFLTGEAVERIAPHLAAVNVDLKAADSTRHRALTGAPLEPVLETLQALVDAGVWVEVSTPLIPSFNDDRQSVVAMAETVARLGRDVPWHLLRFTPEFRRQQARPTSPETLKDARNVGLDAGLRYVYVERALGEDGRTTRCPGCAATLVERDVWATRRLHLQDGACPGCGVKIPGRF